MRSVIPVLLISCLLAPALPASAAETALLGKAEAAVPKQVPLQSVTFMNTILLQEIEVIVGARWRCVIPVKESCVLKIPPGNYSYLLYGSNGTLLDSRNITVPEKVE